MKLVDVNVMLNAVNADSVEHERAVDWRQEALNAPAGVGLAWIVIVGFIRMATKRGMLAQPLGATLDSFDRDFERFAGLRFEHLQPEAQSAAAVPSSTKPRLA